ncbi:hypothetical protein, partial [Methyloceanibacter superfactus]|uniref:hypothetical protein n=1 Tax=Methyloceanibacter superfactus TaxID=1774969 RepID=UPI000A89755B
EARAEEPGSGDCRVRQAARQEIETELATLIKLLAPTHDWAPIVEQVRIEAGYEQALGAALGDDLDAAAEETAPAHWRTVAGGATRRSPMAPRRSANLSKRRKRLPAVWRRSA